MEFTPKQLHYFKRELIIDQLNQEINKLIHSPDITSLLDKDQNDDDFPFLKYIFHSIIIEFPLLKHTCDENFWPKCKVFLNEFNKVQLSTFAPQQTDAARQKKVLYHKLHSSLVFAFCASIKTVQGQEESVKVENNLTTSSPESDDNNDDEEKETATTRGSLKVNIVAVRKVYEKRTLRTIIHPEFLIETYFPDQQEPIYVARRYEEFKRLGATLKHSSSVPERCTNTESPFYCEQDRLVLRAYLQQHMMLLDDGLKAFLSENPILFTPEEEQDAAQREEKDNVRHLEQEKFQHELDNRVHELDETLEVLKKEILQPGGLIKLFEIIKSTKNIEDLTPALKKAFEWGRISFAFALHKHFLTSDSASENLANLRRTHRLMPYRTLAFILRYSNPMFMMKGILDLFLAQPFGGSSLFQRMIISNMSEESKSFEKEIIVLEQDIDDDAISKKLYNAVRAPLPEEYQFKDDISELYFLFNNNAIEPVFSSDQIADLEISKNKKTIKKMLRLWELYTKQYEHELTMELVFQGVTGELLKEFISVFYQPLAEVYKAADISTTIYHVQGFLDDLLDVIDNDITSDVSDSIQLFTDLVARHEQHFYGFVHNVHSQQASRVFDELIEYVDRLFTFLSQGMPGKVDMNDAIREAGIQTYSDLEAEIDALCDYRYKQKVYRFERLKHKFMIQSRGMEDHERERNNEIFQYIPKSSEMEGALGDFDEIGYEDPGRDTDHDDDGRSMKSQASSLAGSPPQLTLIPTIVPYFVKDVIQLINKSQ
ncbi:hypothetical protein K501DRAFT_229436 [Backusella circina FSU 941]|nr:hypothetical protein K501DRAFT_229436 [Backusella circina FSU 941]